MDELITRLKKCSSEYKSMRERTLRVEESLNTLLTITGTDNYGNLIKRVKKWKNDR